MIDPTLSPLVLSLATAGMFALVWGAVVIWRKGDRQKGVLMLIAALVLLGNLLIWTI